MSRNAVRLLPLSALLMHVLIRLGINGFILHHPSRPSASKVFVSEDQSSLYAGIGQCTNSCLENLLFCRRGNGVMTSLRGRRRRKQNADDHDDTVESLSIKMEQHYIERRENDASTTIPPILYTRLPKSLLRLNRTRVGPSKIVPNEYGLFTTKDCRQGDLLTCYPGDAMVVIPDQDGDNSEELDWTIQWANHIGDITDATDDAVSQLPQTTEELESHERLLGYLLHTHDDHGILGLPNSDPTDTAYLGHYINDGIVSPPTCEADMARYTLESQNAANALHDILTVVVADDDDNIDDVQYCRHMVTVATRDIPANTEIAVSYGADYWLEHNERILRRKVGDLFGEL